MDVRHTRGGYRVVLVLASPRRKELLAQIDLESETRPSRMEEETRERGPDMVIMELSRQKVENVVPGCPVGIVVIGADTVVFVGNETPEKSGTPMRAYEMLEKIWGRTHQVYTSVTVLLCQGKDRYHGITSAERTDVHIYPTTCGEVKECAQYGEPLDRTGVHGIQGRFATHIKGIDGDYANVMGLPVGRLCQEIKRLLEDREDD